MIVTPTATLPDVLIIEPRVLRDDRGFFVETYHAPRYRAAGIDVDFVQDNHSRSVRGTLRGLHWQTAPHPQAKLIRVLDGEILDVAVDVREGSPTFGRWVAVTLSADNFRQLFIPIGFAHGFLVTSDDRRHRIQVLRRLRPRGRARPDVERPGNRHRLAGDRSDSVGPRPRPPAARRPPDLGGARRGAAGRPDPAAIIPPA